MFPCSPPAQLETVDLDNTFPNPEAMVRLKQQQQQQHITETHITFVPEINL